MDANMLTLSEVSYSCTHRAGFLRHFDFPCIYHSNTLLRLILDCTLLV